MGPDKQISIVAYGLLGLAQVAGFFFVAQILYSYLSRRRGLLKDFFRTVLLSLLLV